MPDIGLQALGTGFNLGITFEDVLVICLIATFFLTIIAPVANNTSFEVMGIPGYIGFSFNTLWFDNWSFFKDTPHQLTCAGIVTDIKLIGTTAQIDTAQWGALGVFYNAYVVTNPLGQLLSIMINLFIFLGDLIFGCGLGGIRLFIGVAIVAYILFKAVPLISVILQALGALFG
jgi:hypothetical protein